MIDNRMYDVLKANIGPFIFIGSVSVLQLDIRVDVVDTAFTKPDAIYSNTPLLLGLEPLTK